MNKTEEFLAHNSLDSIFQHCNSLIADPTAENIEALKEFLLVKDPRLFGKHSVPKYVSRLFILLGREGFEMLEDLVKAAPGSIYPTSILSTIYAASRGKLLDIPMIDNNADFILKPEITSELSKFAQETLVNIVTESLHDEDLFFTLVQFIYQEFNRAALVDREINRSIFDIVTKSSLRINEKSLRDFERLIDTEQKEESYQQFLENNPYLIDPLASQIYNKAKLGIEHVTDFVIRRLDNEYILVEIEKPNSRVFTRKGDFSFEFTHAMGQVLDFQEWIESNIAYAQKLLPSISSPQGLLVIGLKKNLSDKEISKLNRFNINNRGKLKVITFDEILEQGRTYFNNIYFR